MNFIRSMRGAVLALLASSTGCASMSTMQTASTLGEGDLQVGLETAYQTVSVKYAGLSYPQMSVAVRYGVSDRVDIGGRIGQAGTELQAKFLLTEPGAATAFSLAPTIGGFALGSGDADFASLHYQVPLLIGISTGGGSELVLGPKIHHWLLLGDGSSGGMINAGATVGYALRLGERFALMPEVGVFYPVAVHGSDSDDSDIRFGGVDVSIFHFGLGMLFGG
jgi:hypothetical protein